ncbi:NAD-dependent epimerase/dehydratase family protein [Oleiharenicola lentus]|uniref:NAD-dependent epimerase/dehydratase family protein n=1 Tax=Oleiharenicola lentus TaxID=2508720 RepID=A0A4Q1C9T6_9BACT|nr:NAD-dependent epimerase/dehydratase family protein [Oleiharenicola lentus]RXK55728.1 NAD-dependent epimerase/dehydratase family protein [Oleiharenicola lentus]
MASYLVTGAAGFIASKVVEFLLRDGHLVVGIDNLNDYYDLRLKDWRLSRLLERSYAHVLGNPKASCFDGVCVSHGNFHFRALDVENLAGLDALFVEYKFDGVFNLAARAGVRYSMEHPHLYLSTNTVGALNILECMRKYGVQNHVLASTSSLYAGCPMPFTEELPVNAPLSPYAVSKKAAELMSFSYYKLYGIKTSVVRYFTVYGPAGRPDMSPLRFIKWIDEGTRLELYGDGTQARDFTYVDDIARGTILALDCGGFEIINLGGGATPITLQVLIASIERALGKKALISSKPFHIADVKETWADISKAQRLLNWRPEVPLAEGLRRTVEWHLSNRELVRDLKV